ncbi:MAG: FHA domain-containing protein [Chloroflexota bacterium]
MTQDDNRTVHAGAMDDRTRAQSNWGPSGRGTETVIISKELPKALALLVITSREQYGRTFRLDATPRGTSVGRSMEADAIVDDPAISGQHLRVRLEKVSAEGGGDDEKFFVIDLASANGTKVNGQATVKQELKDGDCIEIGETTLVFKQI